MPKELTREQKGRREKLFKIKEKFNLTNQGISNNLPPGMGSLKTVNSWTGGGKPVPGYVLDLLAYSLEGTPIKNKQDVEGSNKMAKVEGVTYGCKVSLTDEDDCPGCVANNNQRLCDELQKHGCFLDQAETVTVIWETLK